MGSVGGIIYSRLPLTPMADSTLLLKPIVLREGSTLVPRAHMLFCVCPVCLNELNWRHFDVSFWLYATCCCHVFYGNPTRQDDMATYQVTSTPANMQNVYWLHRRGVLDLVPPQPPQRHA